MNPTTKISQPARCGETIPSTTPSSKTNDKNSSQNRTARNLPTRWTARQKPNVNRVHIRKKPSSSGLPAGMPVFGGFAGEAHDEAGADGDAGNGAADALDQLEENIARSSALHALKDAGAGVLERHVDVLGERGVFGDGVEQALGDLIRIGVEEADPLLGRGVDLREAGEQIGQAVVEPEILAVAGGVLADQVDLADALLEEAGGLGDYGFEAPAAESAAILRNHAEGARVIAAFGDLHVGEMVRGGEHSRGEVVIKVGLQRIGVGLQPLANGDDAFQLVGADEGIHFG